MKVIDMIRNLTEINEVVHSADVTVVFEYLDRANDRVAELEFIRESSCKVMQEFADELGCKPDNEVILQAIDDLKSKVAELEKQRDGLVAENAALKHAISEINNSAEVVEHDGCYLTFVVNPDCLHCAVGLIESEIPATDTAIAEIGAQAVEQAAMGFHEKCYAAFEGSDEYGLYIRAELMQVANKLRGGGV